MSKVSRDVTEAVANKNFYSKNNTCVIVSDDKSKVDVYLHGHHIFGYDYLKDKVFADDCGYATKTTQSRLNACFDGIFKIGSMNHLCYRRSHGAGIISEA